MKVKRKTSSKMSAKDSQSQRSNSGSRHKDSVVKSVRSLSDFFPQFSSGLQHQSLKNVNHVLNEKNYSGEIPCRDKEKAQIEGFINESVRVGHSSQVFYIAGVPGIGKTMCVLNVRDKLLKSQKFDKGKNIFLYENAFQLQQPRQIFKSILYKLSGLKKDPTNALFILNNYFEQGSCKEIKQPHKKMNKILILDEMDYLQTKEFDVIYTIVDWMRKPNSRLTIIGISNTIDLPERFSSKIYSRFGSKRLIFPQYKQEQISQILNSILQRCEGVFTKEAVEYICSKISQQQTDIRKCLYILKKSVDRHLAGQKNHYSPDKQFVCAIKLETVKATVKQICCDSFVDSFSQFPNNYKVVLYIMAIYFRQQFQLLAYSELEQRCGSMIKTINQLRAIIYDLKDLGLITIRYRTLRKDQRIDKSYKISKQVQEEFINLVIGVEKIFMAKDGDQRKQQGISIYDRIRK